MPLGLGIVEALRAIPPRIEVAGHGATVRITGRSFEDVLDYARECYESPVVLGYQRRDRLWPRVTLTITVDPVLAASAPPLAELQERAEADSAPPPPPVEPSTPPASGLASLEEIFAHQEELRLGPTGVPRQRRRPR